MSGRQPYDVHARLYDPMGVLAIKLGQWEDRDDGKPYTTVLFFNGGMGATPVKDGEHVLSWPSNISSTPVEVAERNSPLFVRYKRMRSGSGGAGKFRGGLGQDILLESESARPIVARLVPPLGFGSPVLPRGRGRTRRAIEPRLVRAAFGAARLRRPRP